jgi:hypothetical protein
MDSTTVLARLNQLPASFRRLGPNYTALQNSLQAFLYRYTDSMDGLSNEEFIDSATDKWLDVFGLMFGIPRFAGESSSAYLARIQFTLVAWRGTPAAIVSYLQLITGLDVTVTENTTPEDSWTAAISGSVTSVLVNRINNSIGFVRPAGVPFNYAVSTGGLYLSTINYMGRSRLTGSYIVSATKTLAPSIPSSTNNSLPLLPTDFLTDSSINAD